MSPMPDTARVAARRAAGLCTSCGAGPPEPGRSKCEACLASARAAAAERRELAARKGVCEACMRRKRAKGRGNRCTQCADRYLAAQLERERAKRAQNTIDVVVRTSARPRG